MRVLIFIYINKNIYKKDSIFYTKIERQKDRSEVEKEKGKEEGKKKKN